MSQPHWMNPAWRHLGTAEVAGKSSNERIVAYYSDVGFPHINHDEVAWCAAYLGAVLERSLIPSTKSLLARSYLNWGRPLRKPKLGAIAVLTRGSDPGAGHVGFFLAETPTSLFLLGGNQGNAVTVGQFSKSRLLGYRWPSENIEQSTKPTPEPSETFNTLLPHIFAMEGGWTNDPHDPGGPTNRGIILKVFARHRDIELTASNRAHLMDELKRITEAESGEIYFQRYWLPAHCNGLSPAIAAMHFDCAVNQGVGRAIRFLQKACGVDDDGEIGPITRAAIASQPDSKTISRYAELRSHHYKSLPHFWRFGRGWLNRLDKTTRLANALIQPSSAQHDPHENQKINADKGPPMTNEAPKWWGKSLTIWGTIITAASTVLPVIAPILGYDITADMVQAFGEQIAQLLQAFGGIIGTAMALYGRFRATQPIQAVA